MKQAALPKETAVTVVMTDDGIDRTDPDDGDTWRVVHFDVVRNGEVLATLQVTPIDMVVFTLGTEVSVIDRRVQQNDRGI